MGVFKISFTLMARHHGDARCHPDHAHAWCQRLRQYRGGTLQRRFRERVRKKIRIEIIQFLIEQIDHTCLLSSWGGGIQCLRQ